MNELISEFFYEGIRRIIPGLLVIALYYHKEVVKVFSAHHDLFFVMLNACILLIAWVIGFVIEQVTGIVSVSILNRFRMKVKGKQENMTQSDDKKEVQRETRRQGYLRFAERTMCRCLWPIFLFAYFIPPQPFSNFPNILYHSSYGILISVVFFFIWFLMVKQDFDFLKDEKKKTG